MLKYPPAFVTVSNMDFSTDSANKRSLFGVWTLFFIFKWVVHVVVFLSPTFPVVSAVFIKTSYRFNCAISLQVHHLQLKTNAINSFHVLKHTFFIRLLTVYALTTWNSDLKNPTEFLQFHFIYSGNR